MYLTTPDFIVPGNPLSPSSLYMVEVRTGTATLVGRTGVQTIEGLAWSPTSLTQLSAVPEPGSMALLGSGLLSLVGFAWRRRPRPVVADSRQP